jgi:outer membrane protein assembly factor BamB
MLFQPRGCAALLAVIHKNGTLFVYRRDALGAGPVQRVDLGTPGFMSVSGTFAWSRTGQKLYVTTDNQTLHGLLAFRVSHCRLTEAWRRGVHRQMWSPSSPTVANGVVYFGTGRDRQLVAVNARTGKLLWRSRRRIGGAIYAAPTVINGHVFVASWDRRLYRFDAAKTVSRRR